MITQSKDKSSSCDNCNRLMPVILKYEFFDKGNQKPYIQLHLCEDCSNALGNLKRYCMEEGKSFKYDLDEIAEVYEEEKQ